MVSAEFLSNAPIFAKLKPDQLQLLMAKLQRRRYQGGKVIFHQDDPGDRLHIIVKGIVKISILSPDGREKDIARLQLGECFGEMALLDGAPRSATATAVEETVTLVLLREDFFRFFQEHPQIAVDITSVLVRRLRNANQMLGDTVFLPVPTRVAKQLLELAEAHSNDPEGTSPTVVTVGQDELARLVGASRETVSRALNSYRRQGVLTTSHRRITITDLKALEHAASFF